jgi:hypothetical protein
MGIAIIMLPLINALETIHQRTFLLMITLPMPEK